MDITSFYYTEPEGWSVRAFPDMDSKNTLVLAFAAPAFYEHPEPLLELASAYPQSHLIGCSTSGEISGHRLMDDSISVAVVKFERTLLKSVRQSIKASSDSYQAGVAIAEALHAPDLRGIFVLSDGLNINGSELVKGLNANMLRDGVVITGGLAGDGSAFKKTWTMFKKDIEDKTVVAIGFYGQSVHIGHASKGGWDIFGPLRKVTRAKANVLYELDYKPALELYKQYLGEKAQELPSSGLLYPLAVYDPSSPEPKRLVRTILAVDEKNQSLIFAGDIPNGFNAQLMRANFDRLIDSAGSAGELAMKRAFLVENDTLSQPSLNIAISCVGRRLLLGERTEEEIEATRDAMPPNTVQVGFYSYGELSPYAVGACELHNQTMTLTVLYEANEKPTESL